MKYLLTILGGSVLMAIVIFIVVITGMHYGEESPQFIAAIVGIVIVILLLVLFASKILKSEIKLKDIPNGLSAVATVIRSYQSGEAILSGRVATHYQLIIEMNVINLQGETWPAKKKEFLPITQVGTFQAGISFSVKYDPNNKMNVSIDQKAQAR